MARISLVYPTNYAPQAVINIAANIADSPVSSRTQTSFLVTSGGYTFTVHGIFRYDNSGMPESGFVTAIETRLQNIPVFNITDLQTSIASLTSWRSAGDRFAPSPLFSGNDTMFGGDGVESFFSGNGHDVIYGGANSDDLQSGPGNDHIYGQSPNGGPDGDDNLHAGPGSDYVQGNAGDDRISGGEGSDRINGGAGNDIIDGDTGPLLNSDAGNDTINGNLGNDTINGRAGNDLLRGGQGNDSISGDDGADVILGDRGRDFLIGGSGSDQFIFLQGSTSGGTAFDGDIIDDFTHAVDRIFLPDGIGSAVGDLLRAPPGTTFSTYEAARNFAQNLLDGRTGTRDIAAVPIGPDTYLFYNDMGGIEINASIRLRNILPDQITAGDFLTSY